MRLIIEISDASYETVKNGTWCGSLYEELKNGTPLSESEDCVSRQVVIKVIEDDKRNGNYSCFSSYNDAECFKQIIRELPSVTAEKVGRWIKSKIPNEEYVCSECGGACWYYDVEKGVAKSRFCPNCGAKMQEVEE